jgi:hypothetical protein
LLVGRQKAKRNGGNGRGGQVNQLNEVRTFPGTPEELQRQGQDFMAGTVFAAGAGMAFPDGPGAPMPPMFVVYIEEGPATWGPAPQLRQLLALLDELGAVALHESSTIGTSWALLDGPQPLVKLKVEVHEPAAAGGRFEILLLAENYAQVWPHIVDGGMVGITTFERMELVARSGASFSDAMEACVLFGIGASPALAHLVTEHGWT